MRPPRKPEIPLSRRGHVMFYLPPGQNAAQNTAAGRKLRSARRSVTLALSCALRCGAAHARCATSGER